MKTERVTTVWRHVKCLRIEGGKQRVLDATIFRRRWMFGRKSPSIRTRAGKQYLITVDVGFRDVKCARRIVARTRREHSSPDDRSKRNAVRANIFVNKYISCTFHVETFLWRETKIYEILVPETPFSVYDSWTRSKKNNFRTGFFQSVSHVLPRSSFHCSVWYYLTRLIPFNLLGHCTRHVLDAEN